MNRSRFYVKRVIGSLTQNQRKRDFQLIGELKFVYDNQENQLGKVTSITMHRMEGCLGVT
jgi:hypothetical protein